jgi:hypothetical protein
MDDNNVNDGNETSCPLLDPTTAANFKRLQQQQAAGESCEALATETAIAAMTQVQRLQASIAELEGLLEQPQRNDANDDNDNKRHVFPALPRVVDIRRVVVVVDDAVYPSCTDSISTGSSSDSSSHDTCYY